MEPAEKKKEKKGDILEKNYQKKRFYAWQWWKREDVIKADENRFSIRNKGPLFHITPLFITMAADKSTTGYSDSEEMNSFKRENTHFSWEAAVLVGLTFVMLFSMSRHKGSLMDACAGIILQKLQKFT